MEPKIIIKLSEVFEFSHEIARSMRREFRSATERLEAFAADAQVPLQAIKKPRFGKPLANSTCVQLNEYDLRDTKKKSYFGTDRTYLEKSSEQTFVVGKNNIAKQIGKQPEQKNGNIHETPLSSKHEKGSSSTTEASSNNLSVAPKLKDITNQNKPTGSESGELSDGVFKAPLRPVKSPELKNKRCIVFEDLKTDDEDESDEEVEIPIHRTKNFPSWCLARNRKVLARQQIYLNIDVCSNLFGNQPIQKIDPVTVFPEISPTSSLRNNSTIYEEKNNPKIIR